MTGDHDPEVTTPAERALEGHLELLRSAALDAPTGLDRQIIHRARWQRSVRRPLLILGHFAQTLGEGIRLLVLPGGRR